MIASISHETRLDRLDFPKDVRFVLDTDTKNEIDDQFALVYALTSPNLKCDGIYAAPFKKKSHPTALDGMNASYDEAVKVLEMLNLDSPPRILRGSERFVSEEGGVSASPAVRDLISRCQSESQSDEPVYVVAIGALTNVAAAILLEPAIVDRLVVLWLGGQPDYWHTNREFNLAGDPEAARIVLDSGVPLVRFPCKNVAELVASTVPEIERYVAPCGEIGAYLSRIFAGFIPERLRSKPIWDLTPLAWLVNASWVPTQLSPTPRLNGDLSWDHTDVSRPVNRVAIDARRDPILADFVSCLEEHVRNQSRDQARIG